MEKKKTLTTLAIPICIETILYMMSGMVDTLMLSTVGDSAVGAVGTANTYIGIFIIMFGIITSGMTAVTVSYTHLIHTVSLSDIEIIVILLL